MTDRRDQLRPAGDPVLKAITWRRVLAIVALIVAVFVIYQLIDNSYDYNDATPESVVRRRFGR